MLRLFLSDHKQLSFIAFANMLFSRDDQAS